MRRGGATCAHGRGDLSRRVSGDDFRREMGRAKPRDHIQRSQWLRPSGRYAHARTTTINIPSLQQTIFSNASKRTRSVRLFENFTIIESSHLGF